MRTIDGTAAPEQTGRASVGDQGVKGPPREDEGRQQVDEAAPAQVGEEAPAGVDKGPATAMEAGHS